MKACLEIWTGIGGGGLGIAGDADIVLERGRSRSAGTSCLSLDLWANEYFDSGDDDDDDDDRLSLPTALPRFTDADLIAL